MVFVVIVYLQLTRLYHEEPRYVPLVKAGSGGGSDSDDGRFSTGDDHGVEDDLEAAKGGFGLVVRGTRPMEIER